MARRKSSHVEPDAIVAGHTPPIMRLAAKLRAIVKAGVPRAQETGYPGWHAIGCRHPEAGYFCGIFLYDDHIKVYFEHGRYLPDPEKILAGEGEQTRYVRVGAARDIKVAALKRLLKASVDFKSNPPRNAG